MQQTTITPLEALAQLTAVASLVDTAECKDEGVYNRLQSAVSVADDVLTREMAALAMAPKQEAPTQEPFHHYGLCAEQLQQLLDGGLKPEEISGSADAQHDRVNELVWWFSRLTQGNANAKWAVRHACELAYFVAINGVNSRIDLKAIRDAAFKEGVNITPEERGTLERIGFAIPRAIPVAAPAADNGALTDDADLGEGLPSLPEAIEVGGEGWEWEDFQSQKVFSVEHMFKYARAAIALAASANGSPIDERAAFEASKPTMHIKRNHFGMYENLYVHHAWEAWQDRAALAALVAAAGPDAALIKALERIARWHGEFPDVSNDDGTTSSYAVAYGSNGQRDYMRQVALAALSGAKGN